MINNTDTRELLLFNTLKVLRKFKNTKLTEHTDISDFPQFNYRPYWQQQFVNENGYINDSVNFLIGEIVVPFNIAVKRFATLPMKFIRELHQNEHKFCESEIFISSDIRKSLNEMGVLNTYPVNKSFGYLNDIFKQFFIKAHYLVNGKLIDDIYSFDGEEGVIGIIVDKDKVSQSLRELVEEVGLMCGYFVTYESIFDDGKPINRYYIWQLEPIHQIDIAKNLGRYVYHITTANKIDKIKKNGLTSRTDKSSSSICHTYPGRSYVFTEYKYDLFVSYIKASWKMNIIGSHQKQDGKFAIITIDREVIPDVKWFQDLQFRGEPAVYTYTYIPSEAITDVKILETFKWED